jgi:hypothetical protein
MSSRWRTLAVGATIAVVLAFVIVIPEIGGVSTWKYVLAAIGLILIILAGRKESTSS